MIAKALILVVFCVEAIRFDHHADELSEISALIKQFKKPAQKKSQNNVVTVVPKQFKPAQNTTHFDTTTLDVDVDVGPILSKVDVDSVSSGGVEEEKVGQLTQVTESTEVAEPSDCIICENWEDPSVLGTKWFLKKYAPNFGNSYQNSASTAQIIDDPTGEGKGKVLTFTGEVHYGDTFSVKDIGPDCQSETCVWEIEMKGNDYIGGYADQLPNHPSEHGHQWPYTKSSPSDWVKFTQEFTSPYGETHLMFEMAGPGPLYIDNLKVYKKSGDCKCPTENKPGDMHKTIKELLGDIKVSITEEKSAATKAALGECTTSVDENLQLETVVDFTSTTKLEGDATQYTDLVGCSSDSDCEKDTDEEQKKAIAAHDEIIRLEGELDEWEGDKATGQDDLKDNTDRKEALELKNTTHQALHETRMGKFAQAIKILKRIDDALEADSGNQATGKISEVAPASLVSQEEKKIIREVSTVGNAILMMVDQATTVGGDNQQGLVQTLKNLLKTCISKLEGSKDREILAQDKWIEAINAKIKGLDTEIGRIGGVINDLTSKIAENKRLIGEEETKKADAITESNALRDSCVTRHNLFKADMGDFARELAAIATMLEILEDAKLGAKTVEIRDEDENTKHGVKESIGGTDALFRDDFESYASTSDMATNWQMLQSSVLHAGPECKGGGGQCLKFNACNAGGGDAFFTPTFSVAATVSFWSYGAVLMGAAKAFPGDHSWPHYPSSSEVSQGWKQVTLSSSSWSLSPWRLMWETYAGIDCVSYLDDVLVVQT